MDLVYLFGATVLFITVLGMVMGCDKLGARP